MLASWDEFNPAVVALPEDAVEALWAESEADAQGAADQRIAHDVVALDGEGQVTYREGECPARQEIRQEVAALLRYDTDPQAFLCACGQPLQYFPDYPGKGDALMDHDALWAVDLKDSQAAVGGTPEHDVLSVAADHLELAGSGACRTAATPA